MYAHRALDGAEGEVDRTERVRLPQRHWSRLMNWSGSACCSLQRELGAAVIVAEALDGVEGDEVPFAAKHDATAGIASRSPLPKKSYSVAKFFGKLSGLSRIDASIEA